MPRYYFDVHDGELLTRDAEGLDISDRQQARAAAIEALPDIARDKLPDGDERTMIVNVRDEAGQPIFRATLSFVAEWLL